jgi:hypothetical protein
MALIREVVSKIYVAASLAPHEHDLGRPGWVIKRFDRRDCE